MGRIPRKENKNIEFKEVLKIDYHLKEERKQHLAAQMRYLLDVGKGEAVYIIGVKDSGAIRGLNEIEFRETLSVLETIAKECGAEVSKIEKFFEDGKLIAKILISRVGKKEIEHIVVGVCGHVSHGKSTLIGTLITGKPDKEKKAWLYLNVLPHEIERGLSADLHHALLGFRNGKPLFFKNPLSKKEKEKIVEISDKIISFVDTVGHEPWLRTTIRGLIGQEIDYGILVVAADDGVTHITKEHLGLLLASQIPIIVCITKIDKVPKKKVDRVENNISSILKNIGRIPFSIKDDRDLKVVIDKIDVVIPIIRTSARNFLAYDLLYKLLFNLPKRKKEVDKPFLMYIDKVYNVEGVGTVISGTIKQGKIEVGKQLLIGPDKNGKFKKVKVKSIEMHYYRLKEANAGFVVGVALKGIKYEDIERGMVLCEKEIKPKAVKKFDAEVFILSHPTRIKTGYEPVFHCNTISESVRFKLLDKKYLKMGESGKVRIIFKYKPQFLREGDRFIFREGRTKGIGVVKKIVEVLS